MLQSYCCFCGKKLIIYDGKWRDDTNITHEEIIELVKSQFLVQEKKQAGLNLVNFGLMYFILGLSFLDLLLSNWVYIFLSLCP